MIAAAVAWLLQMLVSTHASTVKSLQSQMDGADAQLASLRAQPQTYEVQQQILSVTNVQNSVRQQLAQENASYAAQLNSSDINIKQARDWQTAVKTQDQALLDNVATVNGSVSIQWISLWQLAQRYLPGYWIPGIFALLTIISYLWDRHRTRPVVSSL